MDDREVVAAIATGDPAGIAVAYDRYAAGLYGYCHWMLREPTEAGEAVQDTFVAAAALGDFPELPKLRPWLYGVARGDCLRRLGTNPALPGDQADAADHPSGAGDHAANPADQPAEVIDPEQAELRRQIQAILAELKPDEREVIELSLRHDLYDTDLAAALGVSWSQAHALTSRARGRLEKDLGVLLIARTGREDCPVLGSLLADWDGELTEQTRDLVGGHIEQCGICARHRRGALRPAALSGLAPPAELPPGLRDDVLKLCSPTTPDTPMYRRSAESVRPANFSEAVRAMRWESIRSHPGPAAAAIAVVLWVAAAVTVALLTLTGSHSARAQVEQPNVGAPATTRATAPATTRTKTPAANRRSTAARPSPTGYRPSTFPAPAVQPPASPAGVAGLQPGPTSQGTAQSPSPSKSPSPSPSPSPSNSSSPSPSSSASPSPSNSASPSASPSPTPSPSPSPSPSASPSSPTPSPSPSPSATA